MENNPIPIARIYTNNSVKELNSKSDIGKFSSIEEAEKFAIENSKSEKFDSVIVQEGNDFHVYSIDEIHPNMPVNQYAQIKSDLTVISFVATDPITGKENFMGKQPSNNNIKELPLIKTDIEKYIQKFDKDISKVLGNEKNTFVSEIISLEKNIESKGINVKIELNDDIFENKDKLNGYKNLLTYLDKNINALHERSISNISIVDESDNWWGVKVDLEYDKNTNEQNLEIGDDFLDDWGESLNLFDKDSIKKIEKELGNTLKESEVNKKNEIMSDLNSKLSELYSKINIAQNNFINSKDISVISKELESINKIIEDISKSIPDTKKFLKNLSVDNQAKISFKEIERFENTIKHIKDNIDSINNDIKNPDELTINARLEKTKIFILKGAKEIHDNRNSISGYITGPMGGIPGTGINYSHAFDKEHNTVANINLGTSSMSQSGDIILGLGVGHTFDSKNKALNGTYIGLGFGIGANTPVFGGVNINNSWYLNNYNAKENETSFVGGAYANIGTYNNIGGYIDMHKKVNSKFEIEGTGELSLLNSNIELEGEYNLSKNKDIYLTGGIGTNKLLYAGIGFSDKYELEVGIGGISFGKDSNNLPGETSWEIGMRSYLPIPYFKHHKVPGYQFTYQDSSKEYITPNGTFMTIKKNDNGIYERTNYIPDIQTKIDETKIIYDIVKSDSSKEKREISINSLGYLTVKDGDKVLIDNGLILENLNQADLGIITDQASVLWFDKMNKGDRASITGRREEIPLPLYRAVHQ